jgi:hypothetical protein
LVGHLLGIGERGFVYEVNMPEAMGMLAFIEPSHRQRSLRRSRMEGIVNLAVEALEGGCADLQLLTIA